MQVTKPRTETDTLTEQERLAIRALILKGCDPVGVAEIFGLVNGELAEVCK